MGATRRTGLSRVTLVGERRRIDLVLPSHEPIGRLLPDVIRLLDDRVAAQPMLRHLVMADGSVLPHDSTLDASAVQDGAVLRLVRVQDVPSAPVVHDVTDEVARDLDVRAWRWRPAARRVTAGAAMAAWALAAGMLARSEFAWSTVAVALLVVATVTAVIGGLVGRFGQRGLATTLIVTAGALGVMGAWTLADAHAWSGALRLAVVAAALTLDLVLLGWFSPLGRGGLIGAAAVAVVTVGWELVAAAQGGAGSAQEQARTGDVMAVASVVVLGLLPRLALAAAGLTALDDRRSGGASVSRYRVATALGATHRGLALATVVLAVSGAAAGVMALRAPNVWTVLLAVVVAAVLWLRARAFPLVVEVVVLLLAGAAVAVRLIMVWSQRSGAYGSLATLVALAVIPLAVLAVQPPEHVRVRLRRMGDTAESVGVIALFPLLIGVFGVYGRLLGTFA
ncbi:type VII secretion integral membrane protein EccD [Streptomyces sp. SLBN-118]|uniref:type VII secretion integral membrane protein EccD n=1 Tax=Streptomyces sp. SLBN-118 TaxID=2768454 RepID=UPI001166FDF5|nr:type VII secretion integral membrane protein EccD [Streptomyces sp. SLBN-118]TQK44367.1 type VII secretion integral membrane protein EccD [Streptomyces sp. SLBN-118]